MLTRVISAIVLLPLFFFIIIKGGIFIFIGGLGASLIGLREYFKVFDKNGYKPLEKTTYILATLYFTAITFTNMAYSHIVLSMAYIMFVAGAFLIIKKQIKLQDLMVTLLGFIYIPVFISHINLLSIENNIFIWLVFIFAWGSDTFAYFAGVAFGKNKLIPEISPKKTIEGAIGGVLGSILLTVMFAWYFGEESVIYFIPLAIIGSVVSQLGDLFASAIKREFGIKDYGNLIPGHGGILDRFDSILFTAPLTYYGITFISFIQSI